MIRDAWLDITLFSSTEKLDLSSLVVVYNACNDK